MSDVRGWIWSGRKVAKEMMGWSSSFDEDGTVGGADVRAGQVIFWWQSGPEGGVMGHGRVLGPAIPAGRKGWYARQFTFPVAISKRMLKSPVPKERLKSTPTLRRVLREATRHRPNLLSLNAKEVAALKRLCAVAERGVYQPAGRAVEEPPTRRGAGFGSSEGNRRVEAAAIRAVTKKMTQEGFRVTSVESENRGYDLLCAAERKVRHVEVKGVSGDIPSFPITVNEARTAAADPYFHIAVVTKALRAPRIQFMTGKQFLSRYSLAPLSFMAKAK